MAPARSSADPARRAGALVLVFAALAMAALALVWALPAAAQEQRRATNGWQVCNETSYILEAATGRPEGGGAIMQGWLRLRPGECVVALAAPLARGAHYLHARASSAHSGGRPQWGGGLSLCVDPNAPFAIENPEDCAGMGLESRRFREVQINRRDGWRTSLAEPEPYSLYRARAAGLQRLLRDAGFDTGAGRRGADPRRIAAAIAQFRSLARLPAGASEDALIDALETAARRRSNELGLTLCNRAEAPLWTAIARRRGEGWESRGWWQIAPNACARTVDEELIQEVYYVHAAMPSPDGDRMLAAGGEPFCTSPAKFAVLGDEDCEARYYDEALFTPIATRGRRGMVIEFFDRDFLPAGEAPRAYARRRDATPRAEAGEEPGRQGTISDLIRSRMRAPRGADE